MITRLRLDIEEYGKVYLTVEKMEGCIKVTQENHKFTKDTIRIKKEDGFIVIPLNRIIYYEI